MTPRKPHPLDVHPAFRAVIAAASPIAELAFRVRDKSGEPRMRTSAGSVERVWSTTSDPSTLVGALAAACGDLADGFAAPPESRRRRLAHQRAWHAVREIDRAVVMFRRRKLAPKDVVERAQRAIDRADVLVGALLPCSST